MLLYGTSCIKINAFKMAIQNVINAVSDFILTQKKNYIMFA